MGDDREGFVMTDLTPRQILDAMARALDKTARRFADQKPNQMGEKSRPHQALEDAGDQSFDNGRPD
jgi:hypothetical protein